MILSGICIKPAGGTIIYKNAYQTIPALSSTEAESTAAAMAGKAILHVRTSLQEIGLEQDTATILYEDNQGALLMANAQHPAKCAHHMDMKTFTLQDWVECVVKLFNKKINFVQSLQN